MGPEQNQPPSLVSADPPFGLLAPPAGQIELTVTAYDPNAADKLTARVFVRKASNMAQSTEFTEFSLNNVTVVDPTTIGLRTGSSAMLNLCGLFATGDQLDVYVADRPFSNVLGQESTAPGGYVTESYWRLQCP